MTDPAVIEDKAPMSIKVGDLVSLKPGHWIALHDTDIRIRNSGHVGYDWQIVDADGNRYCVKRGSMTGWVCADAVVAHRKTEVFRFVVRGIHAHPEDENKAHVCIAPASEPNELDGAIYLFMTTSEANSIHIGDEYVVTIARKG